MHKIDWLDRVGDWNPQLARELKGRLKPKLVRILMGISFVGQFIVLIIFKSELPVLSDFEHHKVYNQYCTGNNSRGRDRLLCLYNSSGQFDIDWSAWWLDVAQTLSGVFLFVLLVGGVYILVKDMATEKNRGTLDCIRLSPQSSQRILLGKLLGVPSLIYLTVALALPLHIWATLQAGVIVLAVKYYILTTASCALFYTAALLFASLGGNQTWLASGFVGFMAWIYGGLLPSLLGVQNQYWYDETTWLFISLSQHPIFAQGFVLGTFLLCTHWIWRALNRRFRNPNLTLITKRQSYWITAYFQLILLGFFIEPLAKDLFHESVTIFIFDRFENGFQNLVYISVSINLAFFFLLATFLFPRRQSLQDWSRYQHLNLAKHKRYKYHSRAIDLVLGEQSPIVVAIAINLSITALFWMPWFAIAAFDDSDFWHLPIAALFSASLIWLYCAIAQIILISKSKKRIFITMVSLSSMTILPAIAVLSFTQFMNLVNTYNFIGEIWIFFLFPSALFMVLENASIVVIILGFLVQISAIVVLSMELKKVLYQLGKLSSKSLIEARSGF